MSDLGHAPPPPPPPPLTSPEPPAPPPPPAAGLGLRRTTGDAAVVAGVAGGIARSLRIDPVLVRVAFVVLAVFGGSGILLYVVGWLFIPEEGRDDSVGEQFFRDNNVLAFVLGAIVVALLLGPVVVWGWMGRGVGTGGVLLLLLVAAGVVLLLRRDGRPAAPAAPPDGDDPPTSPTLALPHPPDPPRPPKERSALGPLTVGVALVVAGTLIALDVAEVVVVEPVVVLASVLAVVAVGLLVGTMVGRARGLIALGIVLVVLLIPVGAAPNGLHVGAGAGERHYRPTSQSAIADQYELGAGTLTVDLRRVDLVGEEHLTASVGVGEVIVLLPIEEAVDVDAKVGVGTIDLPGRGSTDGGIGLERTWSRDGTDGSLTLTVDAGIGKVTVMTAPPIEDAPLTGGEQVTR